MIPFTVADIMTKDVFAVSPETSLITAARLFATRHITGAPVIDAVGRVLGVITLSDLVDPDRDRSDRVGTSVFYRRTHDRVQVSHGEAAVTADGVVSDVMSPFVLAVRDQAPLLDAAKLMVAEDVHRLLVLKEGKLAGIVSTTDVLRSLVRTAEEIQREDRHKPAR